MIPGNKDVTILYQGGSGGFALFYYLMLSNQFVTGLEYNNIQQLIDIQYPDFLLQNPQSWKQHEFWPDNAWCKTLSGRKLFLICNPLWDHDMTKKNLEIAKGTHKILLYTNFRLQFRMCWEKQAYWFTNISKKKFNAPISNKEYLKQIIQTQQCGFDPALSQVRDIFRPDQELDLKNFILTKDIKNFNQPNSKQLDFLNKWTQLQPIKVKRLLLE
jgi:hypothetical protein